MDKWAYRTKTELRFIQPGKPIQNAFIESFSAIFPNECLNRYWFGPPPYEFFRHLIGDKPKTPTA
jgi:transposase InsO family protein